MGLRGLSALARRTGIGRKLLAQRFDRGPRLFLRAEPFRYSCRQRLIPLELGLTRRLIAGRLRRRRHGSQLLGSGLGQLLSGFGRLVAKLSRGLLERRSGLIRLRCNLRRLRRLLRGGQRLQSRLGVLQARLRLRQLGRGLWRRGLNRFRDLRGDVRDILLPSPEGSRVRLLRLRRNLLSQITLRGGGAFDRLGGPREFADLGRQLGALGIGQRRGHLLLCPCRRVLRGRRRLLALRPGGGIPRRLVEGLGGVLRAARCIVEPHGDRLGQVLALGDLREGGRKLSFRGGGGLRVGLGGGMSGSRLPRGLRQFGGCLAQVVHPAGQFLGAATLVSLGARLFEAVGDFGEGPSGFPLFRDSLLTIPFKEFGRGLSRRLTGLLGQRLQPGIVTQRLAELVQFAAEL